MTKNPHRQLIRRIQLTLIALSLFLAVGALAYRHLRPTPLQIAEIGSPSGTVTLTLHATKTNLVPGESTAISLTYSTEDTHLTAIQSEISFDPLLVELTNIESSPLFPTNLIAPKIENNKLIFSLGVSVGENTGVTGSGTVITFNLKAKGPGTTTLSFSDSTLTTTIESSLNSLREITNLTLSFTDPSPSPSPSLSSSPSPNLTTPTPSPAPSLTPSPTPNTPSPATKPASPTNLKYNCYSNGNRITLRWDSVTHANSYEIILDQKDGEHDQLKSSTRAEIDLDIKSNTTYIWKVAALKDGVKGDYSLIDNIKCNGETHAVSPTPSSSPSPTPTPTPTKKPLTQRVVDVFKKTSPSPTPTPTLNPSNYPTPTPPADPGRLADIFAEPTPPPSPQPTSKPSLFTKIFLGWQALLYRLVESLSR